MTDRDEQPSLDALLATLEGTFPAQSDLPLAITLLRLLAEGRPVSAAALADALLDPIDVTLVDGDVLGGVAP
jgi:hypothetical protein